MAERTGEWRKPDDKLPPVLQEVPLWIDGRHMVGYYNGIAWFSRRGILPKPPMHWFERTAGTEGQDAMTDKRAKAQKLTPWLPVKVKPVRVGTYEVRYPERPNEVRRRYWNGREWTMGAGLSGGTLFGVNARDSWRGLAEPPK